MSRKTENPNTEGQEMTATLVGATPRLWNIRPAKTRQERKYGNHVRKPWHKYEAVYYEDGLRPEAGAGFLLTAYDEKGRLREVMDVPEAILAEMQSARSGQGLAKVAE